jgi:DNA (cytosine-5)-methyltransferase 1
MADTDSTRQSRQGRPVESISPTKDEDWEINRIEHDCRWPAEPAVGRVANGVPNRVDRLKGLGNAVVPQIPEMIGYAILATYDKKEPLNADK